MTDKPFSAHDLDIDNSGSPISRMLRGKTSRPPTEEEIVDRTRRDTYKNILAGLGVDYEEDASAMALLLKINAEVERAVELRDAASAVVEAFNGRGSVPCACGCGALATQFGRNDNVPVVDLDTCDKCADWLVDPGEFSYAPAWRRLCALVEGK